VGAHELHLRDDSDIGLAVGAARDFYGGAQPGETSS
jgi:hypothetical protein